MEEHVVHTMISPVSLCHLFSDELGLGNSEVTSIFQWTFEEMLWGDTSVTGSFGAKVEPLTDRTPTQEQHQEMRPWSDNPAPVLLRALKEPVSVS